MNKQATATELLGVRDTVCGMFFYQNPDGTLTDFWTIARYSDGSLHGRIEHTELSRFGQKLEHSSTWHALPADAHFIVPEHAEEVLVLLRAAYMKAVAAHLRRNLLPAEMTIAARILDGKQSVETAVFAIQEAEKEE